jgi:cobalt-zinc-cadmium efflux system outer membrane protein
VFGGISLVHGVFTMNSPLRVVLWACISLGATPWAHAQETSVSIAHIYQSTLENSPALRAQGQRIEALEAGRSYANRLSAGPLSLEGSYRSDRSFDNQGLRETELGISAPLWLWNERGQNQNLRQAELDTGRLRVGALKLELAGQVRQVYWNTLAAHLDVEIAQARLVGSKKLMDDVQQRVDAGDLAKADLLQATALKAQAQAEFARALSALSTVGAEFTEVTGLPVTVLANPGREPLPPATRVDIPAHPAYQTLQSEVVIQQNRADLIALQKRNNPEVGLAVVKDRAAFAAPNEKSLVVSTRIPLGSSAEHESRLLAARADETEAQQRLKRAETTLKAQASAALTSVQWFEKLRTNAQEQAQLARQVYSLYQQSFTLGETDLPTLLRFEQQAFEAERLAKKSTVEYSSKVSALRQALGLLPEQAP